MTGGLDAAEKWRQLKNHVQSYSDSLEVFRVAKTIIAYLRSVWDRILGSLADDPAPVMLSYMSDGWSAFIWKVFVEVLNGKPTQQWCRERTEFLQQRGILKSIRPGGKIDAAIRVVPPCPLYHGKTSWQIFASFTAFHKPLRLFTKGAVLTIGCFDGLHKSSLERLMRAHRTLMYEHLGSDMTEDDGNFNDAHP